MKIKRKSPDEVCYLRIRYGVRTFGVIMDEDIHSNSVMGIFLWPRGLRRQFKHQFARHLYNHSHDETVKYMVKWVADYVGVDDNIRDTAVELALGYDPTLQMKLIRLNREHPVWAATGFVIVVALIDVGLVAISHAAQFGPIEMLVIALPTIVASDVWLYCECSLAIQDYN